jgi:uncharacterized protein
MRTLKIIIGLFIILVFISCNSIVNDKPIIDIHCHIRDYVVFADIGDYFKADKSKRINKIGALHIAKRGEIENNRKRNDEIIEISKTNEKIIPICSIHPYDNESAIAELHRISNLGVNIIKLHPITQNFDVLDDRAINIFVEAAKLDLIILIDSYGIVQAGMIEKLLRVAFIPNTRWIFAHMGGADFMKFAGIQLVNELNKGALDNVYFDISATVNIYADSPLKDEYTWIMRSIGIDKILFGTDFPTFSLSQTLESFDKLDLTEEERNKILYENAKRLLEL